MKAVFALAMIAAFAAAYLVGRLWFDETPAPETAGSAATMPSSSSKTRTRPSAQDGVARASSGVGGAAPPSPALPAQGDDALLEAMTNQPEAMLMLREAIYYEFFTRGDRLSACRALVPGKELCWVRLQVAVRGQFAELQLDHVECGGTRDEIALQCIRDRISLRDPIGIPAEAARELGDYSGPIDVSWYR